MPRPVVIIVVVIVFIIVFVIDVVRTGPSCTWNDKDSVWLAFTLCFNSTNKVLKFFEVKKQKGCKVGWKNPPLLYEAQNSSHSEQNGVELYRSFFQIGGAFLSGAICKNFLFFPIDDQRFLRSTISCLLPAAVLTFYPAEETVKRPVVQSLVHT